MAVRRVPSFSSRPGFPAGLRVLLLDCTLNREACAAQLAQCNYEVTSCSSINDALAALSTAKVSSTPFDVVLGEASALTAKSQEGSQLRTELKELPTIVMSESPKPEEVMLSIKLGFAEMLERPLCPLKLKNIWQHAARRMMVRSPSSATIRRGDSVQPLSAEAQRQGSSTLAEVATKPQLYANSDNGSPTLGKPCGSPTCDLGVTTPTGAEGDEFRRPHKRRSREFSRSSTASQLQQQLEGAGRRISAEVVTPHHQSTGQSASGHSSSTNPSPCNGEPVLPPAMPVGCVDVNANTACSLPALTPGCPPMQAWPLPTPPGCLPLGMAWGVPLNPMAVAPGITPPIFPPANPAMMPMPGQSWPQFPLSSVPGMPAPGMFSPLMPGLPMPCGNPFMPPAALSCQLPPLPMSMLMSACGGSGMNMCGMPEGMNANLASLSQQQAQHHQQGGSCSPAPTDPSLETLSDKSAQDVLNLGLDDINFAGMPQTKLPRCESNQLLPSLEDLIADNNDTDMELELEALSLGCLGMGCNNGSSQHTSQSMHHGTSSAMMMGAFRRNDSLDDLINGPSIMAF